MAHDAPPFSDRIQFDRILNFRDIAQLTYPSSGSTPSPIRPGRIFRSARLDAASLHDQHHLEDTLRIRTILDLRTPTEHIDAATASIHCTSKDAQSCHRSNTSAASHLPVINGAERVCVNLNGSRFSSSLFSRLSYVQQLLFLILYILNYRKAAIRLLAENVMAERGLAGLAHDTLTTCHTELKVIFDLLSDETRYPVVIHCTQGKDRTGLAALLIELLMGVDARGIGRDYFQSQQALTSERDDRVREIVDIGLPETFADCEAEWPDVVCEIIAEKFGGIEAYLRSCGVSCEQQQEIVRLLSPNVTI